MAKAATYQVVYLTKHGMIERAHSGAPSESWMVSSGKAKHAEFVIRYFPSRKGWRILDIRAAGEVTFASARRRVFRGQVRGNRYWPTKDAAIMRAITLRAA